ncbi:hypothetical protein [Cyclobacterium qasimii]|uniref:Uncharacterized protein n=2 Tax=Cyclobacterium qasimii TaxID=1350429 RepID=S7WWG2_9BACT|nr:hypothetical protein [Cyclobacterium qasimii]EPR71109.1 hypothetical protein ADICYQ_0700 [Cyclobacterium qasimii M12-11B]GEO21638.1 hypothetical protein CQA01_21720 [Cyclobacterium qasimii]
MEKSIEAIWKEGFLRNEALVGPKITNLYNQKSIHFIDKYKRMFKINLNAIAIGSIAVLGFSFFIGIPIMGIGLFLVSTGVFLVNKKLSKGLDRIDENVNSYQYLKSFRSWLDDQISVNKKMARIYYPLIFLSTIMGFWYSSRNGQQLSKTIMNELTVKYPDLYVVFGMPLIGILAVVLMLTVLAFFGGKIYNWDLNIVYGRVIRKLDELISDMEDLRAE